MLMPALPKVPPANSAASPRLSVCEGVKQLVKSKDYWFIAIPAIVNAGMFYTMTVVIIEAAVPYGYNEQQSGIANALLMISGFAGGGIIGYWIGRTGEHLAMIKLFTPIVCGMFVMVNFQSESKWMKQMIRHKLMLCIVLSLSKCIWCIAMYVRAAWLFQHRTISIATGICIRE